MTNQEFISAIKSADAIVVIVDYDGEVVIEYGNDTYVVHLDDFNTRDQKVLRDAFNGTIEVDEG